MVVHQTRVRKSGAVWHCQLLVRLAGGELRSFDGTGPTPLAAVEAAMEKAVAHNG